MIATNQIPKEPSRPGKARRRPRVAIPTIALMIVVTAMVPDAARAQFPCQPVPIGLRCAGDCPPGLDCTPTRVRRDLGGNLSVVDCECRQPGFCHIEIVAGALEPRCVDPCPDPTEVCVLVSAGNADGTIDYTCECLDPMLPQVCALIPGTPFCGGPCPPGEACVPTAFLQTPIGFEVIECGCQPLDRCRPIWIPCRFK